MVIHNDEDDTSLVITTPKVDVIIVGAGLSGLTSALKILQKERTLQIKILDASNRPGGRLCATPLGEICGTWITEDQYHIYQLMQQLKVPIRRRTALSSHLKRCWELDRGMFASFAKYELDRYISELELKMPYFRPGLFKLPLTAISMHRHICNRLFFNSSRQFMLNFVLLIAGVDAKDISFKEFMAICYTCGSIKALFDIYLEFPNTLLEVSSDKLLNNIMQNLENTEILYWRKVLEIRQFKDRVQVYDTNLEMHTADAVILAIPWNAIEALSITPPIPLELRVPPSGLERSKQMVTCFIAKYNDAPWRKAGYSGNFLSNTPFIVGYEYQHKIYAGYTIHEEGIEPLIRSMTLEELSKHFGEEMLLPEEFYCRTNQLSSCANTVFTTPWNRVVWSSSAAAATSYRGQLGGAIQSGLRAAINAMFVLRPQTVVWQDIAEIQRADQLFRRDAGWVRMWTSSWNLYNVTFYGMFICGLFAMFKRFASRPCALR